MGMNSYMLYGIGVYLTPHEPKNLEKLLEMAPKTKGDFCASKANLMELKIIDDEANYASAINVPAFIASAINEIEGTGNFTSATSSSGYEYLLFAEALPFEYNEKEKSMSEEDINTIFAKYISLVYETEIVIRHYEVEQ